MKQDTKLPADYNRTEVARKTEQEKQLVSIEGKIDSVQSRLIMFLVGLLITIATGLSTWSLVSTVSLKMEYADTKRQVDTVVSTLSTLVKEGSSGLQSHVKMDDDRVTNLKDQVGELKAANATLLPLPGELKSINVKIDGLKEGQVRVEGLVNELRQSMQRKP